MLTTAAAAAAPMATVGLLVAACFAGAYNHEDKRINKFIIKYTTFDTA